VKTAPVLVFVYNRPYHTYLTLSVLAQNELASETELIIISDHYKIAEQKDNVEAVRKVAKGISGFKKVTLIERETNWGLSKSIISGVTEIVNEYGSVIVLEDDLVTSPYFLRFMNEALQSYEHHEEVISIHGYCYPVKETLPETFFLKGADCWGWATWKRGWDLFVADGKKLTDQLKETDSINEFDFNGNYQYYKMLLDQISGKNDSWAIRWYASAFLKNKLTLYPGKTMIHNIGFDNSGTHTKLENYFNSHDLCLKFPEINVPVENNMQAYEAFCSFFKAQKSLKLVPLGLLKRVLK
jgi:hypothetical protein